MTSPRRPTWAKISTSLILFGILAIADGEWQAGLLSFGAGLSVLCGYFGLVRVRRCGGYAPTTESRICGNARRGGLLRGCHLHPWWRVKRWLHLEDAAEVARRESPYCVTRVEAGTTIVNVLTRPVEEPRKERFAASAAVLGLLGGVVTLVSQVVDIVLQVRDGK